MEQLEIQGVAQRDCIGSAWLSKTRPELFRPGPEAALRRDMTTAESEAECKASRRLVREIEETDGLFRTYRCKVKGLDMEVSFSAAKNDRDRFTWCEYAFGGEGRPLVEGTFYTDIRNR
jgi:hypothetical protein